MSRIERVEILQDDVTPKVVLTDAIQSFVAQETPIVRITCDDGATGTGYSYTIGTGGSSVVALLRDHLAPLLIGEDASEVERLSKKLFFRTHATAVGAITSLALAAVDTALWDLRCRRAGLPLWKMAGGAQRQVPTYTTEGGWLHLSRDEIVEQTLGLGCLACEPACPSGVPYRDLISPFRALAKGHFQRPLGEELSRWLSAQTCSVSLAFSRGSDHGPSGQGVFSCCPARSSRCWNCCRRTCL